MGKLVLLFGGAFTALFGLSFIIAPHKFYMMYMGGDFSTVDAVIDGRAQYGGFSLGIGLFLLYCAFKNVRIGLVASLLALVCIILARLIGFAVDGAPGQMMYIFLGLEIVLLALTLLALRKA